MLRFKDLIVFFFFFFYLKLKLKIKKENGNQIESLILLIYSW